MDLGALLLRKGEGGAKERKEDKRKDDRKGGE